MSKQYNQEIDTANLNRQLQVMLQPVLTQRRTTGLLTQTLMQCKHEQREWLLHWAHIIATTNAELAWQFLAMGPDFLRRLDRENSESWLFHTLDSYDHFGLDVALRTMGNIQQWLQNDDHNTTLNPVTSFDSVRGILEKFVCGLSGRQLNLAISEGAAWTNTETLYLPRFIKQFPLQEENRLQYKILTVMLWAQTRFGSFRLDQTDTQLLYSSPHLLSHFDTLETWRLLGKLREHLPGIYRRILAMQNNAQPVNWPVEWEQAIAMLHTQKATVQDSLHWAQQLGSLSPMHPWLFSTDWQFDGTRAVVMQRMAQEKLDFQQELANALSRAQDVTSISAGTEITEVIEPLELALKLSLDDNKQELIQLGLEHKTVSRHISPRLLALLQSIIQDLGSIPADYLQAAGPSDTILHDLPGTIDINTTDNAIAQLPEWDYRRMRHHKAWCDVFEKHIAPGDPMFARTTLHKHAGLVLELRKSFESLRDNPRWLRHYADGDELDIDAITESLADQQAGNEVSPCLYLHRKRQQRDIAVMFVIDMSGSTRGWINQTQREALILLCDALERLGDQYAIAGFSGHTRKRCDIYRIKSFHDSFNETVQRRIAGIKAKDYTRMGFAIRHLSNELHQIEARTHLLISLSDGQPDDFDGYRDDYGIEDTRQALIEVRNKGIHSYCITLDSQGRDYLPHMYGAGNYTIIQALHQLPKELAHTYRRLTR
jgi:nitric oxide reductase NorD protein